MNFAFHPEALEEFKAEISYYERKQEGLGREFANEVSHMNETFPKKYFDRLGLVSLLDQVKRIQFTT